MNITRQIALIAVASTMLIVGNGSARAQTIDWVRQFGSTGRDFAYNVAVDTTGNVYVVGDTSGRLPGEVSGGFLAHFDVAGNLVWVRPVHGAHYGLATDRTSFVFVAGWSNVAKYDASGVQQWVRTFDLPGFIDEVATGVATDLAGNAYVVGRAWGPSISFVGKYDPSGTQLWFHTTGGESLVVAPTYVDVATADTGHVYIAGQTNQQVQFLTPATVSVRQYDLAGNAGWDGGYVQQMYNAGAGAVTTDTSGNIYVAGGTSHLYLPSEPRFALLIRFDTAGNRLWVQTLPRDVLGGAGPADVAADSQGNVYLVGGATIVAFDSAGTQLWARQIGDPETDLIQSVAVDASGALYLTGYTTGALPGESPLGGEDAFIMKLTPPANRIGYYEIVSRGSDKCLDVYGASTDAAASVIQWVCHGGENQQWQLEPAGDGVYRIVARHSGQVLDVYGALLDDVTPTIQYPSHGGDNQLWTMEPASDGYVRFVARHSGKVLDVEGGSMDDGARVIQYTGHGGPNQQWRLRAVAPAAAPIPTLSAREP